MNNQVGQKRPRDNADVTGQSLTRRTRRPTLDPACDLCKLMFSHRGLQYLNSLNGLRHRTRTDCEASGNNGCEICKFIFLVVYNENNENWTGSDHLIFRNSRQTSLTNTDNIQPGIYGLQGTFASKPNDCIINIHPFAEGDNLMGTIVQRRPLHRDVQSDRVFSAAKALMRKCMDPKKPHKNCQYSRDTVLPLRVLDVGIPEDSHSTIKLKVNEMETHAPYLALSYCWGRQPKPTAPIQPLQLRSENLKHLETSIKLESLQQSIQDAIFVTRKLGFRYLWVDALCIIQNCAIDKHKEISRMSSIYKNATITIAASSSQSAADGFLSKTIQPYCPDLDFCVPLSNDEIGTVYLSAGAYEPEHHLDTRGWTLQEFMLSSRMLLFSDYELLWQCKEVDLRGVSGRGLEYTQLLETLPWIVFDEDAEPDFGSIDMEKIYLWKTIIQQYTERSLKEPGDRLNAIMGITCDLETLWHDEIIYGLWKKWFIELLAWYKPASEREKKRHLRRAPSWSWASLNGVIRYKESITREDAKVKSLTVSAAELTCRILKASDVDYEKALMIDETPDLTDAATELGQNESVLGNAEYLLLGTFKSNGGIDHGIGLLIADVGTGLYRRVGLVIFRDMEIWNGVKRRDITLEGKIGG
ncbi:hypothetical protein ACHAQJ_001156 [Trichoderma viride]